MIRANYQQGVMLPEYTFMRGISDDYARGMEITICRTSLSKTMWDKLFRYPSFGMSFYFTTMGSKKYLGDQYSVYPYFHSNILRRNKFELGYQMGVGISYATKKYDATNNYLNLAIGSHLNIHYHADLLAQYQLNNSLSFHSGIAFSHISNANLSEPNVGINISGFYAGIGYSFGKTDSVHTISFPPHEDYFSYEVMVSGGMKHTRTFESFQYPAIGLSFDVKRRLGYKFALGIGVDVFYDSSTQPQMDRMNMEFRSRDAYSTGIHLAQEFFYNQVSFIVQEGFYIGLKEKIYGYSMYNRAIARYHFCNHYFVGMSMKSHLYILDFPELSVGYYW